MVLRINSPGGSPVQAGILYDEITRLKKLHGKKVYAVVEEICASGAYYIAASADEIYVDKASIVGSIGVLMDGFGFTGVMEKLGVERRLLTAGENKACSTPSARCRPSSARLRRACWTRSTSSSSPSCARARQAAEGNAGDVLGLFWNGEEAVKMGLADDFGNLDFVAREVVKAEEVLDYTPRDNVAERLAKRFAAIGSGAVKALREMSPIR